jgi:glycosyltransferase involved in cell wall biosynthesis
VRVLVQGLVAAPGGSLTVLHDLVAAWPDEDELLVLCWRPAAAEMLVTTGRDVQRLAARSTGEALLRLRPRIGRIVRDFRPDVVWSQATLALPPRSVIPEAVHYRDIGSFAPIHARSPRRWAKERIERRDLLRADLRIFNSAAVQDAVALRYPDVGHLPSTVAPNGLVLGPFAALAGQRERRDRAPSLLLPQSDMAHKRNPLAAEVLRSVRDADPAFAGITLTVAGAGRFTELRTRAAALGVLDAISFLGHVPRERMAQAYADADLVLITSSGESFCNPIVEAHAVGRQVVLPPIAAALEIRGPLSTIAEQDTPSALSAAIIHALGRSADPAASAAARSFAERFSAEASAGRLRTALSSLLT